MAFLLYKIFLCTWLMSFPVHCGGPAKSAPELILHPRPKGPSDSETSLIWYASTDQKKVAAMVREIDEFINVYKTRTSLPGSGRNLFHCFYDRPPQEGQVCDVDVRNLGPCTSENNYGYHRASPCIFLSLEKMFGWQPEFYNDTDTLPSEMPRNLKAHIASQKSLNTTFANQLWVSCNGEIPVDVENIGTINYFPQRGFPGYFFPFEDVEGNLSPLVAVQFQTPIRGVVISVECKIWARNINNSQTAREGTLRFELLVD